MPPVKEPGKGERPGAAHQGVNTARYVHRDGSARSPARAARSRGPFGRRALGARRQPTVFGLV